MSHSNLPSRSDELRLWLFVAGALNSAFFLTLVNAEKPLTVVGVMFFIHLIITFPVLFAFHRTAVAEALSDSQDEAHSNTSNLPCNGSCGTGGTPQAFICYAIFFSLATHRLATIYTTCAFSTYKLHLDWFSYLQLSTAFLFLLGSVVFVEIGRRHRASNAIYML